MAARRKKVDVTVIDEFIAIRRGKLEFEKRYKELRDKILGYGTTMCKGTDGSVVLIERSRTVLDTNTLKADYGTEWYDSYCHTTVYYELEVI